MPACADSHPVKRHPRKSHGREVGVSLNGVCRDHKERLRVSRQSVPDQLLQADLVRTTGATGQGFTIPRE
jgi:hypothetical protein